MALSLNGFEVASTAVDVEAITLAKTRCPCLTLVDYRIPGIDVERLIGALRRATTTTIALCTAADSPEPLARRMGADLVLAKPFTLDALLDLARRAAAERGESLPAL